MTHEEKRVWEIKSSVYQAPTGYFDQALTGHREEKNLWEVDIELRLESLRRVFAGMAVAPTCWCMAAAAGYQMKSNGVSIPGLVGTGGVLLALVAYIGMFLNSTKFNTNLWLYSMFIGGISAYAFQNAAETETTHHKIADASFILGWCYCLMTLYSLLSIHCPISLFDIKPGPGQCMYIAILVLSVVVGIGEALAIKSYSTVLECAKHAFFAILGGIWVTLSFVALCFGYDMFRRGHDSALVIYAWIWPVDVVTKTIQSFLRALDEDW